MNHKSLTMTTKTDSFSNNTSTQTIPWTTMQNVSV